MNRTFYSLNIRVRKRVKSGMVFRLSLELTG